MLTEPTWVGRGWEEGVGENGEICNIVNNNKKNLKQESWCGDTGNLVGNHMCMASSGGGWSLA